jgi:hypothetical protein
MTRLLDRKAAIIYGAGGGIGGGVAREGARVFRAPRLRSPAGTESASAASGRRVSPRPCRKRSLQGSTRMCPRSTR